MARAAELGGSAGPYALQAAIAACHARAASIDTTNWAEIAALYKTLAAVQPWPFHLPYAAANAGVEQAARSLRLELEGTGIRVTMLRCGETGGTDFATRELASGRMTDASEYWFRRGLLRHAGLMTPGMVADAVAAAVTLPPEYQYESFAVIPTAPVGDLPRTFEEFGAAMIEAHLSE